MVLLIVIKNHTFNQCFAICLNLWELMFSCVNRFAFTPKFTP
ncbi:hypothetical protein M794_2408 [Acinetobacter baumannii 1605]|nr:hypothetical protein ACINBC5_A0820 [Acinetobacter baumannii Canada BC-5]EKK13108.1 hypothetical protein ACINIS235_0602 [Acinetobacter baumannii IS-235]EKP63937.1 hypothetical protein ACINCANBC1_0663 [Acinetobacter baumannii Canada BC1]EPS76536.1 hypothetical protein M794_2408 [Acinetobacter baumannii 1605]ETQ78423.1 hypothetical protein P667_0424 [Acinetobacter baumannii UH5107]KLT74292.1 hypothetical protein T634_0637 [Acinetobacter baumannii MRSN 7339]KLT90900.1 hypothetical protein T633